MAEGAASANSRRLGLTVPARPAPADPSGWQWQVRDAVIIATLVAAAACAERLDVARATVASVRAAGGNTAAAGPPWWLWVAVTAIGVTAAWLAIARAAEVVGSLTAPANARHFADLARMALGVWGLWQVAGLAAALGAGVPSALLAVMHLGAYTVAAIALVGAGRALVGDPAAAWRRTSFVRIELIVLAAIFAVMLLASLTAAQVVDVLRAWGDGSPARAVVGLSSALLLGAVCRAGAYRMLVPRRIREPYARPGRNRPGALARYWALVVVPPLAVAAGSAAIGAPLGVAAAVVFLAVGAVTRWATPIPGTRCVTYEHVKRSRRLAGTLAVVPMLIVYAGLVGATLDSFLLPEPGSWADVKLLIVAVVAGALFGWLCVEAHRAAVVTPRPHPWRLGLAGLGAALAAGLAPNVPGEPPAVVLALPLLALGLWVAGRRGSDGAVELWAGGGVGLGTAVAIYADPIDDARVLGSIGLALIAATGLLVLLHGAASLSTRRAPGARGGGCPTGFRL